MVPAATDVVWRQMTSPTICSSRNLDVPIDISNSPCVISLILFVLIYP